MPKKSPMGTSMEGVLSWSHHTRRMLNRQFFVMVIQICWMAPGPSMFATSKVSPGSMSTAGATFQPRPRSRALCACRPSTAMPPAPFAPVGFSAESDRVFARDRRDRLPRSRLSPLYMPSFLPVVRLPCGAEGIMPFPPPPFHRPHPSRPLPQPGGKLPPRSATLAVGIAGPHLLRAVRNDKGER